MGLHHRSMEATARWHRTVEEVAAVSAANIREPSGGKFIVKFDLNDPIFSGGYKERDLQIAEILRSVADRMMRGQYMPDMPNRLFARPSWKRIGFFKFKEG